MKFSLFDSASVAEILVQLSGAVVAGGIVCAVVHFALVGAEEATQATLAVLAGGLTAGFATTAIKKWWRQSVDRSPEGGSSET